MHDALPLDRSWETFPHEAIRAFASIALLSCIVHNDPHVAERVLKAMITTSLPILEDLFLKTSALRWPLVRDILKDIENRTGIVPPKRTVPWPALEIRWLAMVGKRRFRRVCCSSWKACSWDVCATIRNVRTKLRATDGVLRIIIVVDSFLARQVAVQTRVEVVEIITFLAFLAKRLASLVARNVRDRARKRISLIIALRVITAIEDVWLDIMKVHPCSECAN
jgi:hypothetical protein